MNMTATSSADWPLWRCVMQTPSGWPEVWEVKAPKESMACLKIKQIRPQLICLSIERRPTVRG